MPRLTKRAVEGARTDAPETFVWCSALPGFGLRVYKSGRKVFIAQVRVGRGQRRVKIGDAAVMALDTAREKAKAVIEAATDGRDPQAEKREHRQALTVAELCEQYMTDAEAGLVRTRFGRAKAPSTLAIDRGRVDRHIVPLIGKRLAKSITRADVQRMSDDIARGETAGRVKTKSRGVAVVTGGTGTAARVVDLLGGIFAYAMRRELVPGPNPAHGVETARGGARDRTLTPKELGALGKAIEAAREKQPATADAITLIALTGLRRDEACGLRWSEVDVESSCLRLAATKTGRSMRPLGAPAVDLLRRIARTDDTWVFPAARRRKADKGDTKATIAGPADLKKRIAEVFDAAGLHDARAHDLRRTFASMAAAEGFGDAAIGELLGHAKRGVTERHYVRRPDSLLISMAGQVSRRIANALAGGAKVIEIAQKEDGEAP